MALIVEDGTAKIDSESYIAVADATTYHANRGNAAWADLASDTVREQLLRKATDYMVQVYRLRWKGLRVTATQALDWPRNLVERADYAYASMNGQTIIGGALYYPSDEVPDEVANACAELALTAATSDLNPAIGRRTTREKVDVIEVEYDPHSPLSVQFRAIDGMLAPFLDGTGGTFRKVVRT